MATLDAHYHGCNYPESFKVECYPGTAEGPPYHVLQLGPVTCFLSPDQLWTIACTIKDTLESERRPLVARQDFKPVPEAVPGTLLGDLLAHERPSSR